MKPINSSESVNRLYATDASVYQQVPASVVWPKNKADCIKIIKKAAIEKTPLIPRAAGTSIAGQCVGAGIVVDISRYMTEIEGKVENKKIRVQPGVILDDLNDAIKQTGLKFAPDISTSNRCMIAGMIGNNAAGSHSVIYGATRDHIDEIEAILSDGSVVCFKPLSNAELEEKKYQKDLEGNIYRKVCDILDEHRELIVDNYPKPEIIRRNTGYALDYLANLQPWNPDGSPFNLASLIAGSEGTLAFIVEATLKLIKRPRCRIVICSHFSDLNQSMETIQVILNTNPAAVELMDKRILDLSAQNIEQSHNRFWVQGDPAVVLVTEYFGDSQLEVQKKADALVELLTGKKFGYAHPVVQENDIGKVWAVRKAGLGLLMGVNDRRKPIAVIEDTAVAVSDLPAYITDIQVLMKKHKVACVYYGHASVGLLHIRPELDLSQKEDKQTFNEIAIAVAGLVKKYKGSLSGEHGDGRVRGPFLRQMVGDGVYKLHQEIKNVFDPDSLFNPDKILTNIPIDSNFRASVSIVVPDKTGFDWSGRGGFGKALEKCNGVGVCRKSAGRGVMCPTYQATKDERFSTRGRANLLRFAFSENNLNKSLQGPLLTEVLESCLGCKACKSECPSNVDMSRLKVEALYQRYSQCGIPFRVHMSGYYSHYLKMASYAPLLVNFLQNTGFFRSILGVSKVMRLPDLARESAQSWWEHREIGCNKKDVILLVDIFANYLEPEIMQSAVNVLERTGHKVTPIFMVNSPRQLISKGLLGQASNAIAQLLQLMDEQSLSDLMIIGLEPSELLTLRDEAVDLIRAEKQKLALLGMSKRAFLLDEYLLEQLNKNDASVQQFLGQLDGSGLNIYIHTHCHQKTLSKKLLTKELLDKISHAIVSEINSGCCGMAGQFGYEQPELSRKIANTTLSPYLDKLSSKDLIVASGASCRSQIKNIKKGKVVHIAQLLCDLQSN